MDQNTPEVVTVVVKPNVALRIFGIVVLANLATYVGIAVAADKLKKANDEAKS